MSSSVCPFIDREKEMAALDRAWRDRPGLAVVYGRRRVGKTRTIVEWARSRGVRTVYYLAQLASHEYNLARMAETASRRLGDPLISRLRPSTVGDLLDLIARTGDVTVVIDEFTYWVRSRGGARVLSEIQEFLDHRLQDTGLLLVLSGSLVGVMESSVLGGGAPLYDRPRVRVKLAPLKYAHARRVVPRVGPADAVRIYALVGGIPYYLCLIRDVRDAGEAVRELIASPGAPLLIERDMILREEVRDPHTYIAVLSALARGHDTPAKISQATGLDSSHVSKYLHVLEYLGIVRREAPLFKKRGRHRIADPVLRTWFTLVEPVLDLLEVEAFDEAFKLIMERLDAYTALAWEEIVRAHLLESYLARGYTKAGRLEHKGEEVDVAVVDERAKRAVVAEAKWSDLTLAEAQRLRRQTLKRAERLLPEEYVVEEVYIAARSVAGEERPSWLITPDGLERAG